MTNTTTETKPVSEAAKELVERMLRLKDNVNPSLLRYHCNFVAQDALDAYATAKADAAREQALEASAKIADDISCRTGGEVYVATVIAKKIRALRTKAATNAGKEG